MTACISPSWLDEVLNDASRSHAESTAQTLSSYFLSGSFRHIATPCISAVFFWGGGVPLQPQKTEEQHHGTGGNLEKKKRKRKLKNNYNRHSEGAYKIYTLTCNRGNLWICQWNHNQASMFCKLASKAKQKRDNVCIKADLFAVNWFENWITISKSLLWSRVPRG